MVNEEGRLSRYTVIINGNFGYCSMQVKGRSYTNAEAIAKEQYKVENPEDTDVGCAGVIKGWHEVWGA